MQKGVEEIIMKAHVADNRFIYSLETPVDIIVCQDQEISLLDHDISSKARGMGS